MHDIRINVSLIVVNARMHYRRIYWFLYLSLINVVIDLIDMRQDQKL